MYRFALRDRLNRWCITSADHELTAEEKEQRELKRKILDMAKDKERFETKQTVSRPAPLPHLHSTTTMKPTSYCQTTGHGLQCIRVIFGHDSHAGLPHARVL
jgi:hypothetical protein